MGKPSKPPVEGLQLVQCLLQFAAEGKTAEFERAAAALKGAGSLQNITDESRRNALHLASAGGHVPLLESLIDDHKFDVNAQDARGSTPLAMACGGQHEAAVALLLRRGADANPAALGQLGPIHQAARTGNVPILEQLLRSGADANAASASGTPLLCAAGAGSAPAVSCLLAAGADPTAGRLGGMSPLFLAAAAAALRAKSGSDQQAAVDCVRALVDGGAPVTAAARGGFTPLHVAAEAGSLPLVGLLLERGADPEAADEEGHTPIQVAAMWGHREAVQALLAALPPQRAQQLGGVDGAMAAAEADRQRRVAERESGAAAAAPPPSGGPASGEQAGVPEPEDEPSRELAESFKKRGNEFFGAGDYDGAASLYTTALTHWTRDALLWANRAAAYLKLGDWERALADAAMARTVDPACAKGWYREGLAAEGLARWEDAAVAFFEASKLVPGDPSFQRKFREAIAAGRAEHQAKQAQQAEAERGT